MVFNPQSTIRNPQYFKAVPCPVRAVARVQVLSQEFQVVLMDQDGRGEWLDPPVLPAENLVPLLAVESAVPSAVPHV